MLNKENKELNKSLNEIRNLVPTINNYKNIIERFCEALAIFDKAFKDIDLISYGLKLVPSDSNATEL